MNHLTDCELLKQTKNLVQKERELLTEVLAHLREISDRKLFSELGYKSLFEFAVKHLGYSEGQAYRRINAMKLLRQLPGLEEKIQSGQVNLSHIGIAQNLFQQEAKSENPYSLEQKQEVLNKIAGTSSRQAEKITQQLSSSPETLRSEKVKSISDTSVALQITVSNTTMKQVETLKGWLAHKYPGMSTGELFEKLCKIGIEELNPSKPFNRKSTQREAQRTNSTLKRAVQGKSVNNKPSDDHQSSQKKQIVEQEMANSRCDAFSSSNFGKINSIETTPLESPFIRENTRPVDFRSHLSSRVRRLVFSRAHNQCEKCQSGYFLEIDHRIPVALGGTNDLENLRLLCRNCNQRAAIDAFGKEKILSHSQGEIMFGHTF